MRSESTVCNATPDTLRLAGKGSMIVRETVPEAAAFMTIRAEDDRGDVLASISTVLEWPNHRRSVPLGGCYECHEGIRSVSNIEY
ncbi:MAG: hypothetical protein HXY20_12425 [Acidobacteria bacterium]|nr:hypothetical protein [Acidobacteriota bacterium]